MSNTNSNGNPSSNTTNDANPSRRYSSSNTGGTNYNNNNNPMDLSGRSLSSSQGTSVSNSNAAFTPQHPFPFPSPTTASPQQQQQLLQQAQVHMQFQQHMQMQQHLQHQHQQQPYHPQQMQQRAPQQSSPGFSTHSQSSPPSSKSTTSAAPVMIGPPPVLPPPPLTGSAATGNASQKSGSSTNTGSNKNTKPQQSSYSATTTLTTKQRATSTAATAPPRAADLLAAAPWADRALWVSRQFLGGNTINGFLRCTTSMKRTKRQRMKQLQQLQKNGGGGANTSTAADPTAKDIVVPRVAKKIKTDLEQGMTFCRVLHETIRSLVQEIDPALPPIPPLRTRLPAVVSKSSSVTLSTTKKSLLLSSVSSSATTSKILPIGASRSGPLSRPLPLQRATAPALSSRNTSSSTTKSSNNGTSTLRSRRKHPLPRHTFDPAEIPPNEGRTPEEQTNRTALLLRYRALRQGDVVAARLSSRDLWILARVVHSYPGPPPDFLSLNPARRDNHFRDQSVAVTDVEDDRHKASTHHVARSHVLPLPRTPVEASAWAQAFLSPPRKQQHGSNSNPITVYAMYPATTSLYTASIVDSTTYCHGDDDIVVVQFDGDEPDAITGRVPHRHIPARFVVRVPPADNNTKKNTKPPHLALPPQQQEQHRPFSSSADALSNLDALQLGEDLPGIDDLDFDLGMDD